MKNCYVCQKSVEDDAIYCTYCGTKLVQDKKEEKKVEVVIPLKKRGIAITLAFLLGIMGVHNYYLGHKTKFYVQFCVVIISFGLLGLIVWPWSIVEGFIILFNKKYKDGYGRELVWENIK